jgi:hypothetical protein
MRRALTAVLCTATLAVLLACMGDPTAPGGEVPGPIEYSNCAAARSAGAAPLQRGDPGYRPELDRDGDGVACDGP